MPSLKDIIKASIVEMSRSEKEELFKHLVGCLFEDVDTSRMLRDVFNDVAEETIRDYIKQENAEGRIRREVSELLNTRLGDFIREIMEDDDDFKDDLCQILEEPMLEAAKAHIQEAGTKVIMEKSIKATETMLKNLEVEITL